MTNDIAKDDGVDDDNDYDNYNYGSNLSSPVWATEKFRPVALRRPTPFGRRGGPRHSAQGSRSTFLR